MAKDKRPNTIQNINTFTSNSETNVTTYVEPDLIIFNGKVKITLILIFLSYLILSFAKIHTSSVAFWDVMFGINEPKSLIWGRPQPVRQDEWMLSAPSSINLTKGKGKSNKGSELQLTDIKLIIQPQEWASKLLPSNELKRKFAFKWNFTIFLFFASCFLFLLLLTKNNFGLSLFGTFFIFLSGAVQWWSYQIAFWVMCMGLIFISSVYLLLSRNRLNLIISGWIFLMSSFIFVAGLYPAWQVPVAFLLIFIFVGFILDNKNYNFVLKGLKSKVPVFSVIAAIFILLLYNYYDSVKDYAEIMLKTVYPGRRISNGGDLAGGKLFSEYFGVFMSERSTPEVWLNICEASSFIMFFPIVFYAMLIDYLRTKKIDWILIALSFYVIILLVWLLIGFPNFLSSITMMTMSPPYRTLPILGLANVILLIAFLARRDNNQTFNFSRKEAGILILVVLSFFYLVTANINQVTGNFFNTTQVLTVIILMTVLFLLIRYSYYKFALFGVVLILMGFNIKNIKVNPLTSGLSAIIKNPLVRAAGEIKTDDPTARWAVFGNQKFSNLLKPHQIDVINGIHPVPNFEDMKILDPTGKDINIYNRYAHINLYYHKDGGDNVYFQLNENKTVNDNYTIIIHPCSEKLKQLKVKYTVFTYPPTQEEIMCMTLVKNLGELTIYKRNDL